MHEHICKNTDMQVILSHVLCFFDQLRTQALASLHSGLLNNQGLPVAHVGRWLGMEVPFLGMIKFYNYPFGVNSYWSYIFAFGG